MKILVVEHERGTGPERFGEWLEEAGAEVVVVRPYLGEAIPMAESGSLGAGGSDRGAAGGLGEYAALLVLGGAAGPLEDAANPWFPQVRDLLRRSAGGEFPSFNICLGGELLAAAADAPISRRERPQIGIYDLATTSAGDADPVFAALSGTTIPAVLFHQEEMALPENAELLVTGSDAPVQGSGSANSRGGPSSTRRRMSRRSSGGWVRRRSLCRRGRHRNRSPRSCARPMRSSWMWGARSPAASSTICARGRAAPRGEGDAALPWRTSRLTAVRPATVRRSSGRCCCR